MDEKKTIEWNKTLSLFEKSIRVVWLKDGTALTNFQVGSFGPPDDPEKVRIRAFDEDVVTWRHYRDDGKYVPKGIMSYVLDDVTMKHNGNSKKDIHEVEIYQSNQSE
jgi:hypothetical protein